MPGAFLRATKAAGAYLGLEAVRLTLQWLDGRVEPSSLMGICVGRNARTMAGGAPLGL